MKKKDLKEKLNIYADSLKLDGSVLNGAFREMELKKSKAPAKNKSAFKKRYGFAVAAAVIVFVVAINFIIDGLIPSSSPNVISPYSLSSLQKEQVAENEYLQIDGILFLTGETGGIDGRFYVYTDEQSGEVYAVKAVYRTIRNGFVDEITVISDLKNKLTDYESNKPRKSNEVMREFDVKERGEYCSYFAVVKDNKAYYVMITSPLSGGGEYYENLLL